MIPALTLGQIVAVFGPVASGKTFLLQQWIRAQDRTLIFDTAADHTEESFPEATHVWRNPKVLSETLRDGAGNGAPFRVVYHPLDVEQGFDWCVKAIWQVDLPRWFVIEEIHEVMSPHSEHPMMRMLNKYARKRAALGVIGSSQRIADVHKNFTSAARMTVLFHTQESADTDAIRDRYGSEVEDQVRALRALEYDDATGRIGQTPQAIVLRRGQDAEVIEVG